MDECCAMQMTATKDVAAIDVDDEMRRESVNACATRRMTTRGREGGEKPFQEKGFRRCCLLPGVQRTNALAECA
jgi:hypothetical protein